MKEQDLIWEPVKTEHIVRDKWIDFRRMAYRLPDGTVFEPFYNYSRRSYVVVVPSDPEGNYLCVRQFRHGIGQVTTEFPAGGIERSGDADYAAPEDKVSRAEATLETAKRELLEETGYTSDQWTHLLTVPSNATISDNYAHLYLARNCRRVSGLRLDDTEFLDVVRLSPAEIDGLIEREQFQQAMHILAWLLVKGREA